MEAATDDEPRKFHAGTQCEYYPVGQNFLEKCAPRTHFPAHRFSYDTGPSEDFDFRLFMGSTIDCIESMAPHACTVTMHVE